MLLGQPISELEVYRPALTKRDDFEEFWKETLAEHLQSEPVAELTKINSPITEIEIFDVVVPGFNNDPIKGWFLTPRELKEDRPIVVIYEGYGGGRGNFNGWLFWANCGYPTLVMDTRGQGGGHRRGDTPDGPYPRSSSTAGFMTMGIESKADYYYRRVFSDAVAFVRAAKTLPHVNPKRIVTTGGSQGGGIALAAASLAPEVFAAMPDVPFLCHIHRAIELTDAFPYQEIVNYCRIHRTDSGRALQTLTYFDVMNLVTSSQNAPLKIVIADLWFDLERAAQSQTCSSQIVWLLREHSAKCGGDMERQFM